MVIGGDVQSINGILEYARKAPFYQGRLPDRPLTSVLELTSLPLTTKAILETTRLLAYWQCLREKQLSILSPLGQRGNRFPSGSLKKTWWTMPMKSTPVV